MINSQLRWQSVLKGSITYIPLFNRWSNSQAGSPVGARYFYSVWLRHLVKVASVRPNFCINVVAELGPGDALGIGICALLSGAQRYIGLDRIAFGLRADNLSLLDESEVRWKRTFAQRYCKVHSVADTAGLVSVDNQTVCAGERLDISHADCPAACEVDIGIARTRDESR